MIKVLIHQKNCNSYKNIYVYIYRYICISNKKASICIEKTDKIEQIKDNPTIIIGDLNTPLSVMDTKSRQKISNDIENWNNTTNQIDVIDVYRIL